MPREHFSFSLTMYLNLLNILSYKTEIYKHLNDKNAEIIKTMYAITDKMTKTWTQIKMAY